MWQSTLYSPPLSPSVPEFLSPSADPADIHAVAILFLSRLPAASAIGLACAALPPSTTSVPDLFSPAPLIVESVAASVAQHVPLNRQGLPSSGTSHATGLINFAWSILFGAGCR
jgi:hypothetical protein